MRREPARAYFPHVERYGASADLVRAYLQKVQSRSRLTEARGMVLWMGLLALLIAVAVGVCLGRRWPASDLPAEIASVTGKHS